MTTTTAPISSLPFLASVGCFSLEEVKIASEALAQHRAGALGNPNPNDTSSGPKASLADRIETALHADPLNKQRRLMLEVLVANPPGFWVSYDTMKSKFVASGMTETQASAALRDLSWQMGARLPKSDTAGLEKKILVLAERSRKNGVMNYRLTQAGRAAVEAFLESEGPSA